MEDTMREGGRKPFDYKATKEKGVLRMNGRIKRKMRIFFCTALAAMFLVSAPCTQALAAEADTGYEEVQVLEASVYALPVEENTPSLQTLFGSCSIDISGSDSGMLIEIHTQSYGISSVIGVKDIKIQKKVWYGWQTVATSSGGELTNVSNVVCSVLYENAEKGETYKITCVHYANVDGYKEGTSDTGAFVYNY